MGTGLDWIKSRIRNQNGPDIKTLFWFKILTHKMIKGPEKY